MKLTRIRVFLVNIHMVYAFYKISKTALTILLSLHISIDYINIYNFCIDTKYWKIHLDILSGHFIKI